LCCHHSSLSAATYNVLLVIGHWPLVIGHWSLVIGHWSLVSSKEEQLTTNN